MSHLQTLAARKSGRCARRKKKSKRINVPSVILPLSARLPGLVCTCGTVDTPKTTKTPSFGPKLPTANSPEPNKNKPNPHVLVPVSKSRCQEIMRGLPAVWPFLLRARGIDAAQQAPARKMAAVPCKRNGPDPALKESERRPSLLA
jgi:hypothetical protein